MSCKTRQPVRSFCLSSVYKPTTSKNVFILKLAKSNPDVKISMQPVSACMYNIQNSINESYIKIVHMFVLKCVFYVLQHSLCKKEQNRPLWHAYVFVSWVVCLYCDAIV